MVTKLLRCVAAAAIGAAIVTAAPGFACGAPLANRHYVGGVQRPACFRHHRHFRNFAFAGGPFFYEYAGYGNYCWQQVWTPSGWQWLDACAGYYGFGY